MRSTAVFSILIVLGGACRRDQPSRPAVLLVTPEVQSTGMPQQLITSFQRQTGRPVTIRIVTEEQIASADAGQAAIYTNPDVGRSARLRAVFALHDRYILGAPSDPAGVGEAESAADAFARIAVKNRVFCSAVDVAAIQSTEREIWSAARVNPRSLRRYRRCRGDAVEALKAAERMDAYTLADRATVEKAAPKNLRVLLREKPLLHEEYVVALLQSDRRTFSRDAEWFVQWLMSYRGRESLLEIQRRSLPSLNVPGQH